MTHQHTTACHNQEAICWMRRLTTALPGTQSSGGQPDCPHALTTVGAVARLIRMYSSPMGYRVKLQCNLEDSVCCVCMQMHTESSSAGEKPSWWQQLRCVCHKRSSTQSCTCI